MNDCDGDGPHSGEDMRRAIPRAYDGAWVRLCELGSL